jgi:hypothetical protein
VEDLYVPGDHVLLDGVLHRTVVLVDLEEEEPRLYLRLRLAGRVYRADLGHLPAAEEGPYTPYRVMPYRPSKRARWRRLYGLVPA